MDTIIITNLYKEIIYYMNTYRPEPIADNEDDFTAQRECAYRKCDSLDDRENDNEKVRRYLTDHFRYLMKNVLYIDMNKYKAKGARGSYYIYKKDAPIIKEILLRSVSHNLNDIIIGRWLEGKIEDDNYYDIIELSGRLFYVIRHVEDTDSSVKELWIETLKLALRTDMAYAMVEVTSTLKNIFFSSLQFKTNCHDETFDTQDPDVEIDHSYISSTMINQVNALGEKVKRSYFKMLFSYMESADFGNITDVESFPPLELMKMKNVCELFYKLDPPDEDDPVLKKYGYKSSHGDFIKHFPNSDKIDVFTDYFISIDKEYKKRLEQRKEKDMLRHIKNSKKSS